MPQNPIQKAHLEGVETIDNTMIEDWLDADAHSNRLPTKFNFSDLQLIGELLNPRLKSFLTTYAENILNAAKEAGPREKYKTYNMWNDCRLFFHSAIDEGIKEIKKGDV